MSHGAVVHASIWERSAGRVERVRRDREASLAGSAFLVALPGRLRATYPGLSVGEVEALVLPAWGLWFRGRLGREALDGLVAGVLEGEKT